MDRDQVDQVDIEFGFLQGYLKSSIMLAEKALKSSENWRLHRDFKQKEKKEIAFDRTQVRIEDLKASARMAELTFRRLYDALLDARDD